MMLAVEGMIGPVAPACQDPRRDEPTDKCGAGRDDGRGRDAPAGDRRDILPDERVINAGQVPAAVGPPSFPPSWRRDDAPRDRRQAGSGRPASASSALLSLPPLCGAG